MSKLDTEHWKFHARMGYTSKPQPQVKCEDCGGRGRIGGGWADPEDPITCWRCSGRGQVEKSTEEPQPDVPEALIQHMKSAFNEWYDKEYPDDCKEVV